MSRTSFASFHGALWGTRPPAWLADLAGEAATGRWPESVRVPSGEDPLSIVNAAVHALAVTASRPDPMRRLPRRLWWVVDRRPLHHEMFPVARRLAVCLRDATSGPLAWVAARLRNLGGAASDPLGIAILEGGIWRDAGGCRIPSQPTLVCTSLSQAGGAALFRAPGAPASAAGPLAGLFAHDSLVLIEGESAAPAFLSTLGRIRDLRAEDQNPSPIRTPFQFSLVREEPSSGQSPGAGNPVPAGAPVDLVTLPAEYGSDRTRTLAALVTRQIETWARDYPHPRPHPRVGIVLNRSSEADALARALTSRLRSRAEVRLLVSTMRPCDLERRWPRPQSADGCSPGSLPDRPEVLLLGPCVEAGAGFRCDALISEGTEWEGLKRRFRLLAGQGWSDRSPRGVIFSPADPSAPEALASWRWLQELALPGNPPTVTISEDWVHRRLGARRGNVRARLVTPHSVPAEPAVLLPAHLDLLGQTRPRPVPEPDVGYFIHGRASEEPEARLVLRADLVDATQTVTDTDPGSGDEVPWVEAVSLLPPGSGEMYPFPLRTLKRLLRHGPQGQGHPTPFVLWRGRDGSRASRDPECIRPDDVVVLSAHGLDRRLLPPGWPESGASPAHLDRAELSHRRGGGQIALRLNRDVLAPWIAHPLVRRLVRIGETQVRSSDELRHRLEDLSRAMTDELRNLDHGHDEHDGEPGGDRPLPEWWIHHLRFLAEDGFRCEMHPVRGCLLRGLVARPPGDALEEDDLFADEDDLTSRCPRPIPLAGHGAAVGEAAATLAERCLGPSWGAVFHAAGLAHDLGKLDRRFQQFLRFGDEVGLEAAGPVAKSPAFPEQSARRREIRQDAGLSPGFRHEALSVELLLRLRPADDPTPDLALHLVASHHGQARPFLPPLPRGTVIPPECVDRARAMIGAPVHALRPPLESPARLGSVERFWRLTRRHGWWGLAYLEAILRGANRCASRRCATGTLAATPGAAPGPTPRFPTPQPDGAGNRLPLEALRAANPLSFLASMGALRILSQALPVPEAGVRLGWRTCEDGWRPFLEFDPSLPLSTSRLGELLWDGALPLESMFTPALLAAARGAGKPDRLSFPLPAWREFCRTASPRAAEYAATWAIETALEGPSRYPWARRTRFDFTAGQQAFVRMLRDARETVSPATLIECLARRWRYLPRGISFRWDPLDEKRQYALQAVDPANTRRNPPLAVLGAHLLAAAALPLFPLVPDPSGRQIGFSQGGDGRQFQWPIWTEPATLDTIRTLLAVPWDDSALWPARRRAELGVVAVFQATMVQPGGRYRCFTPARAI